MKVAETELTAQKLVLNLSRCEATNLSFIALFLDIALTYYRPGHADERLKEKS